VAPHYDEAARLAMLLSYRIDTSVKEQSFDSLAQLAADICQAPMCAISLVTPNGLAHKASIGIRPPPDQPPISTCTSPLAGAAAFLASDAERAAAEPQTLCKHAVQNPLEMLIIEDTLLDERSKHNPMVTGAPFMRSYFAANLVDERSQQSLGTLCVADTRPRQLNSMQRMALQLLARVITTLFENQRHIQELLMMRSLLAETRDVAEAARAEAQQAMQGKSDFLSAMSHEIRTPMNAVRRTSSKRGQHRGDLELRWECACADLVLLMVLSVAAGASCCSY